MIYENCSRVICSESSQRTLFVIGFRLQNVLYVVIETQIYVKYTHSLIRNEIVRMANIQNPRTQKKSIRK